MQPKFKLKVFDWITSGKDWRISKLGGKYNVAYFGKDQKIQNAISELEKDMGFNANSIKESLEIITYVLKSLDKETKLRPLKAFKTSWVWQADKNSLAYIFHKTSTGLWEVNIDYEIPTETFYTTTSTKVPDHIAKNVEATNMSSLLEYKLFNTRYEAVEFIQNQLENLKCYSSTFMYTSADTHTPKNIVFNNNIKKLKTEYKPYII